MVSTNSSESIPILFPSFSARFDPFHQSSRSLSLLPCQTPKLPDNSVHADLLRAVHSATPTERAGPDEFGVDKLLFLSGQDLVYKLLGIDVRIA